VLTFMLKQFLLLPLLFLRKTSTFFNKEHKYDDHLKNHVHNHDKCYTSISFTQALTQALV